MAPFDAVLIELKYGGGTPKTDNPDYWDGNIKWLSGGDIAANHKRFVTTTEKSISEMGLQNSSAKKLPSQILYNNHSERNSWQILFAIKTNGL